MSSSVHVEQIRRRVILEGLREQVRAIPGLVLMEEVPCRKVMPSGSDVPNWQMVECTGMLVRHEGPHSWERRQS